MKNLYFEDSKGYFASIGLNGNSSIISVAVGQYTTIHDEYELRVTREDKRELKAITTLEQYEDWEYLIRVKAYEKKYYAK